MNAVIFDSHAFVRRMQTAGMPEAQAEALASEHARWFDGTLATKDDFATVVKTDTFQLAHAALAADLRQTEQKLSADLRQTEQKLSADLRQTEQKLSADLQQSEQRLSASIRESELKLQVQVEAVRADILKWMFGTIGFQTLVLLGAIVALARALH